MGELRQAHGGVVGKAQVHDFGSDPVFGAFVAQIALQLQRDQQAPGGRTRQAQPQCGFLGGQRRCALRKDTQHGQAVGQ
jgi:hypothetical protein